MPATRTLVAAVLALTPGPGAQAHHPGSHASRLEDGRVRVEVVATVAESCTEIVEIRSGAPPGVAAAPGSTPVTARLGREGPCAPAVRTVHAQHVLEASRDVRQIHLHVLAPDGSLAATERFPVR